VLGLAQRSTRPFDVEAELAGDGDLVTERRKCLSDKGFTGVGTVDLGGVEERDPLVVCGADRRDALTLVGGRSIVGADAHAPCSEFGNL
jgi:hypothetical protein